MIEKSFIFLAGHHRSGTSLMHEILRDHPSISGFIKTRVPQDEGQHLQNIIPSAKFYGGPGKYIFDERSYMNEDHYLATDETSVAVFQQWEKYFDETCPYYIEKSPPNLIRTRFLQRLFPNSKFVVIFRHPIAIAYATQKMSRMSIGDLINHTLLGYEIFLRDMVYLKNFHVFRYEDFIQNPQYVIDQIYDFLNLESIPLKQVVNSSVNDKYFTMWNKTRQGVKLKIIKDMEVRANKFGYGLERSETLNKFPL